jgi:predicted SnoaL-like aldol condensation-catalyzing enzyme
MPRHLNKLILPAVVLFLAAGAFGQETKTEDDRAPAGGESAQRTVETKNKELARRFYEQIWFSKNTDEVFKLVAPEYKIHDIGGLDGEIEKAAVQKEIADFLHSVGDMSGTIDYQIAEGDLVATRWYWTMNSKSLWYTALGGGAETRTPIINVFRFKDGKIVEIWNHRHDIDTPMANIKLVSGLVAGFVPAAIAAVLFFFLWRRARKVQRAVS